MTANFRDPAIKQKVGVVALVAVIGVTGWSLVEQQRALQTWGPPPKMNYGIMSDESLKRAEPEVREAIAEMRKHPVKMQPTIARNWVPASEAKIKPETPVVGISINGESKCYALTLPARVAGLAGINDELGGKKVLVTH
jgi:hypothetical protein